MTDKSVTISIHLGTGKQGELRKQALEAIASLNGHVHNGKPSIGRWLVAQSDEWIEQIYGAIQAQKELNS